MCLPLLLQSPSKAREFDAAAPAKIATHQEDRLLVKPKSASNRQELDRFHAENDCEVLRIFPGFGGLQVLRIPKGQAVQNMIRKYQSSPLVEYAEPDYRVRLDSVFPNDPSFLDGKLWALNNAGQDGGLANADIDAPEAWSALTSASNVIVAVIDSGVRYTHEDLAANMWTNPHDGSHGINALTGSTDPNDDNGHGTRVAGVIGAVGNNGLGVVGVAWRVQIMACKFVNSFGYGTVTHALACLDYARTNGAHVINASWGLDDSLSLSNAMLALRESGIIVVAAAGNESRNIDVFPHFPASYDLDNIITVAATTRQDGLYILSNFGATNVDLAAPGDEIYSTHSKSDTAYSFDGFRQGDTSMAAAYVSGAAALVRAAHSADTPAQIIERLLAATDPLPSLVGKCVSGGRLNLRKAMGVAISTPRLGGTVASPKSPFQPWPESNTGIAEDCDAITPPEGLFVLRLSGNPGRSYVVEVSPNLYEWIPVSTNLAGFNGCLAITNSVSTDTALQFYRVRLAP